MRLARSGDWLRQVAYSPAGDLLVGAGTRGAVHFWEASTGKALGHLQAHRSEIGALAFAADGNRLLTTGKDGTVLVWDVATSLQEAQPWPEVPLPPSDSAGVPLPKGAIARLGSLIRFSGNDPKNAVLALAYSPDGQTIVTGSMDHKVRLWQTKTGKNLLDLQGHSDAVTTVAFGLDGKSFLSTSANGTLFRWNAITGKQRCLKGSAKKLNLQHRLSLDGAILYSVDAYGVVIPWEIDQAKERRQFNVEHPTFVISPDGAILAAKINLSGPGSTNPQLWKAGSGKRWWDINLENRECFAVAFSRDGRMLATSESRIDHLIRRRSASYHSIRIWETATGRAICKIQIQGGDHPSYRLAFSPDGQVLAHDMPGTRQALTFTDISTAQDLTLVSGKRGEGIVFPLGIGLRSFQGHEDPITCAVFAPSGKTLATSSYDGTALVWDTARFMPEKFASKPVLLSAKTLETLWADLADQDAGRAYRAIAQLSSDPERAVPFLVKRLHPVARVDPSQIEQWIKDLGSNQFSIRQKALTALEACGESAESALRQALKQGPTVEVRRRVELLLQKIDQGILPMEQLRSLRALTVLEHSGREDARKRVTVIAGGAAEAWLTREAQASLQRMTRRASER